VNHVVLVLDLIQPKNYVLIFGINEMTRLDLINKALEEVTNAAREDQRITHEKSIHNNYFVAIQQLKQLSCYLSVLDKRKQLIGK
jgi:hypothetical protein